MHIPDNYLSPATCAVMAAAAVPPLAVSVRKVKQEITKAKMPLLGVGAAFSFLIMMFNVPLPGGTTGHAVGGTLAALLLGPWAACVAVTSALVIQALLFGDGGVLAIGANIFNMACVLPLVGYAVYRLVSRVSKNEYAGAAVGSYVGLNASALCAAIEFGVQPLLFHDAGGRALYCPYPLAVSIPAMMIPHLLVVGVVEAAFTVSIFAFVKKVSPATIYGEEARRSSTRSKAIYILLAALIALAPLGLLAAGTAWGEWSPETIGMADGFQFGAIFSDYSTGSLPPAVGYVLSAVCGAAIFVILFKIIGSFIKDKR